MSKKICTTITAALLISAGLGHELEAAESLLTKPFVSGRIVAGQTSLDGPAVTGPEEVGEIEGEESESGVGPQLEFGLPLGGGLFVNGLAEWISYGNDPGFDMSRASLGLGIHHALTEGENVSYYVYGIAGAEYARSSGLSEYKNNPTYGGLGDGKSGDDVGIGIEGGIGALFGANWEANLYSKYYEFFDGAGPGFGTRIAYTLNDQWRLLGSWDGLWVEDAGYNIDIDTQRFTLGAAYTY